MEDRGKTAIIMTGSAMRSSHGAGFLYALAIQLGITQPDIMIGSSGDAGNVLYYSANQPEQMKRIWTEILWTSKFVSFWRFWRIMDVDYLIDTVFRQLEPLDVEKLQTTPIQWFVPVSDFDTGKTRYIGASDDVDPFELLRAAKAIPILFGKKVPLAHGRYIDGELGPILQDHLEYALSRGARNIVIVNHCVGWTRDNSIAVRLYAHLTPPGMRDAIIRDITHDVTAYSAPHAKILLVSPQNLPCNSATHKKEKIRATFDRGVADALALKDELRKLFAVETPAV
jgi:predicted patatin/cPLA2 family phospholipase